MEMQVWFLAVAEKHKNLKHQILSFCLIIAEWQLLDLLLLEQLLLNYFLSKTSYQLDFSWNKPHLVLLSLESCNEEVFLNLVADLDC